MRAAVRRWWLGVLVRARADKYAEVGQTTVRLRLRDGSTISRTFHGRARMRLDGGVAVTNSWTVAGEELNRGRVSFYAVEDGRNPAGYDMVWAREVEGVVSIHSDLMQRRIG